MANNRLWMLHRPSKTAVCLGKRMGSGWYRPPDPKLLEAFYDFIEVEHFDMMDDFELLIEHSDRVANSVTRDKWTYEDFKVFKPALEKRDG